MDNAPKALRTSIHRQIVDPIVDVIAGRLPVTRISHRLSRGTALRLAVASRKPKGQTTVRNVMVQILPRSIEVTATVAIDGRVFGLGLRVERHGDDWKVVRLDAPGLL